MARLTLLCWVVVTLVLLSVTWHSGVSGLAKKDLTYQVQQGIRAVHQTAVAAAAAAKAAQEVSKTLSSLMKVASLLGKAAPFLSVFGFLVPFIMSLLGGESPQMQFLRSEFFKVNQKLDKISNKLDKIDDKITFESQRAAYIAPQEKIRFNYRQMQQMLDELAAISKVCKSQKECKRQKLKAAKPYIDQFAGTEEALSTIFRQSEGSIMKEPLMQLFRKNYDCDIPRLSDAFGKLWGLARKAQMVLNMKEKLTGSNFTMAASSAKFINMMYDFRSEFYSNVNFCIEQMYDQPSPPQKNYEANLIVKDIKENSDKDVKIIQHYMQTKYSWLKWVGIAFVSVTVKYNF